MIDNIKTNLNNNFNINNNNINNNNLNLSTSDCFDVEEFNISDNTPRYTSDDIGKYLKDMNLSNSYMYEQVRMFQEKQGIINMINSDLDERVFLGKSITIGENNEKMNFDFKAKHDKSGDIVYCCDNVIVKIVSSNSVYFPETGNTYILNDDGSYSVKKSKLPYGLDYDFIVKTYFKDGTFSIETTKDDNSVVHDFDFNNNIILTKFSDGTNITYYENGNKKYIVDSKGNEREFYENGNIKKVISSGNVSLFNEDGKIIKNNETTYEYDQNGNVIKIINCGQGISEINNFYLDDGSLYKGYKFDDGSYKLIEYELDGKTKKSEIVGTVVGSTVSKNGTKLIPKIKGDTYIYSNNILQEKILSNGVKISYDSTGINEKSCSFNDIDISVLLHKNFNNKLNLSEINNVSFFDNHVEINYGTNCKIELFDSYILGRNENGNITFGYCINDENELSNVTIFGDKCVNNSQYGGSQMVFSINNKSYELLNDERIYNELEKWFPNSSHVEKLSYLNQLCNTGCGYVGAINGLFKFFEGREEEFYNTFDFDMYKISSDGNIDFNYEYLILEFYNYNWMKDGQYTIEQLSNDSIITGFSNITMENFSSYLNDVHNINIDAKLVTNSDNEIYIYSKEDIINQYMGLVEQEVDNIMICSWGYKLLDYYDKSAIYVSNEGEGHGMVVVGMENGDLIVSSWGKRYILDLDYMNNYNQAFSYFYAMDY